MTMAELYNPFAQVVRDDPFPIYRTLREELPVYHNPVRNLWALSRYDDVLAATRDWETFSHAWGVELDDTGDIIGPGDFLDTDPPLHDALRKVVRHRFAPKRVLEEEAEIRGKAVELLEPWAAGEEVELSREVCWRLPVWLVSRVFGFPDEDAPLLIELGREVLTREVEDGAIPDSAREAYTTLRAYLTAAAEARMRAPGSDLLSDIVQATIDGRRLELEEILGMCVLLFVGGTETTASFLATSLVLLERRPDAWDGLRARPEQIPAAIEELLRFDPPFHKFSRTTTRPVELHGVTIPAHARVVLLYASANRDERRFAAPDELDFEREQLRHLAFGNGVHFCLGAPLARLETRIALEEIARRIGRFEITAPPERLPTHGTRGFATLRARRL